MTSEEYKKIQKETEEKLQKQREAETKRIEQSAKTAKETTNASRQSSREDAESERSARWDTTDKRASSWTLPIPFFKSMRYNVPEMVMACNFVVCFNGTMYGFNSVSGFSEKVEYEMVVEGGNNDFPRLLRSPKKTPYELTFKRGYVINKAGIKAALTGLGDSRKSKALTTPNNVGIIFVLNRKGYLQAMYSFVTLGLKDWTMGELNAQTGKHLIETFTVYHRGLTNIPIPWLDDQYVNIAKNPSSAGNWLSAFGG